MSEQTYKLDLSNVRRKAFIFNLLPWLGKNTATTIYPYVYVPSTIYRGLMEGGRDPYHVALVLHEQEHIKRIAAKGVLAWYAAYFYSRHFRFNEELEATKPQLSYIKRHGLKTDLKRRARLLSGWLYFWPVSHDVALRKLSAIWDES